MAASVRCLPGATAQPVAPAHIRRQAFSKRMAARRGVAGKISLGLMFVALLGLVSVDWFRQDNAHWPYGWLEVVREHPRIATDALMCLYFFLLFIGGLVFALIIKHELKSPK
jgi:hypothetical protein